ncbi:MAG: hypothetical protein HZB92_01580, partial [Euryarchaeota archaeon]|nr:hypothetical protein [Euryarchaeota archaeon]
MTFKGDVKLAIKRSSSSREDKFDQGRMVKLSQIEAMRKIQSMTDSDSIDELAKKWEADREEQQEFGYARRGKIIQKRPFGKVEFTYDPYNPGAPVRLRVITNIQSLIQQDMFDKDPQLREKYKQASWTGDSETNFILPEDYDRYYKDEKYQCLWLQYRVGQLYHELLEEALGLSVEDKGKTIVYVSQFEVCHEEPFTQAKFLKPFNRTPDPPLFDFMYRAFA